MVRPLTGAVRRPARQIPKHKEALEQSIVSAVSHMPANGECYADPGTDYFTCLDPIKAKNNAIKKLNSLGFKVVIITPAA